MSEGQLILSAEFELGNLSDLIQRYRARARISEEAVEQFKPEFTSRWPSHVDRAKAYIAHIQEEKEQRRLSDDLQDLQRERDHALAPLEAAAPDRHTGTSVAESRCYHWLLKLMKNGRPSKNKPVYRAEAQQTFGVSLRAFDRCWGNAVTKTNNTDWSKPGRRPGPQSSTDPAPSAS